MSTPDLVALVLVVFIAAWFAVAMTGAVLLALGLQRGWFEGMSTFRIVHPAKRTPPAPKDPAEVAADPAPVTSAGPPARPVKVA